MSSSLMILLKASRVFYLGEISICEYELSQIISAEVFALV